MCSGGEIWNLNANWAFFFCLLVFSVTAPWCNRKEYSLLKWYLCNGEQRLELLGLCVQGAVGRICKVTICSTNPAGPNHSRESSGRNCCLHRKRQDMLSQRQIINGTLIQPGDVPAKSLVFNLSLPCPGCSASEGVEAALYGCLFSDTYRLPNVKARTSQSEPDNTCLLVAFSRQ